LSSNFKFGRKSGGELGHLESVLWKGGGEGKKSSMMPQIIKACQSSVMTEKRANQKKKDHPARNRQKCREKGKTVLKWRRFGRGVSKESIFPQSAECDSAGSRKRGATTPRKRT